ncbi:hypothetical protein ACFOON_10385 [Novosphingobium piscinae]|uniref:Uncharacterized protein n=1 Tax=Novosphingobium piscinae TaxID=1507448 RepID=A0A7X1FZU1_9SPHN|nr:hypothetical protein [Novosphingobium piscinae]MBC2670024.1 hypothetical protein [Novosphingobium piscinae]
MNIAGNPRMTIVVVIAFLIIVALFISPGGPAEQATGQITEAARATAGKPPARSVAPPPQSWFAPEDEAAPPPPPPPASAGDQGAALPAEPGGFPVRENPPPRGPDFPENN